jgi:hypothetical protein
MLYLGVSVNTVFVGTNGYITFKTNEGVTGSTTTTCYTNNPAGSLIFCGSRTQVSSLYNFSCQTLYTGVSGVSPNRTYRMRWEGTNATSGVTGSPNMVFEITFYENSNQIDTQVGQNAAFTTPIFYDTAFSGTSAACPVAAGIIATQLQTNRSWTYANVRTWLQSITLQSTTTFYQGPDPSTATSADWADVNSLMGGERRVIYTTVPEYTGTFSGTFTMASGLSFSIV